MLRAQQPKPRRTWPQRFVLGFGATIVVIAALSAAMLAYARETVGDIPRIGFGSTLAPDDADADGGAVSVDGADVVTEEAEDGGAPPINFLLVGVDSIATLPPGHPLRLTRGVGNLLTDTMIVLRVDPETGKASALSIPRDLWVPIAGTGQNGKLNSALALGGPEALVGTIQDELNIPINRYVQVDFNGFLELIDVIGGVDVFVEYPLRDPKAQFAINETGCVSLTPDQALGYVRARTLQALVNGNWIRTDRRNDLGRIDRQQEFLVLTISQAFSRGLTDPATLKGLFGNVLGGQFVTLDDRITLEELLQLALDFRSFGPNDIDRYTLPVDVGSAGELSVVRLIDGEAEDILAAFRSEGANARSFRLVVRNGEGTPGLADEARVVLAARGFNVVEATNADRFGYQATLIQFDPSQRASALELQRWLVAGAILEERPGTGPIELVLGVDYVGLLNDPRELGETTPLPGDEQLAGGGDQVVTTDTPLPTPTPEALGSIRGC